MIQNRPPTEGVPGTRLYEIIYGSHAHGTATPTSDIDTRGVYILPTRSLLGVYRQQTTWERKADDAVFWEVGHFVQLLLKGNPNIVGMLFTPDDTVVVKGIGLEPIIQMRERFLSRSLQLAYYHWIKREIADIGKLHKGNAKRLSHVPRLMWELESAMRDGHLIVRPSESKIETIVAIKTGAMDYDEAVALVGSMLLDLEQMIELRPALPDAPFEAANDALLSIRWAYGGQIE